MDQLRLVTRLLDVIEHDIVPLTRRRIEVGNKIFGAAILKKSDLSLVIAESNNETENPIWHGEMHAIRKFYELPRDTRPDAKDCIFLATHEPCSLCLSGITWSGFDNFYYLFDYEDTRDAFAIPYDIQILRDVYAVPDPDRAEVRLGRDLYNRRNAFFVSHGIRKLIKNVDRDHAGLTSRVAALTSLYQGLSATYQSQKGAKGIPLS